ncbi:ThiF family adenylyltransferase [Georgenia muralis]|uniref:Molybdopterin/thiamine biosynthesis adenylyltransferase n=1 Tax=Georgenia muralis TaxID=154117 RepID=A0A3N4Z9I8_9MICO|nr:ThiF family adenylyltransferase [Georgenia muralis]RPF28566.1 molybdopterin/thiamine biosynthesis adenylyltransferase [Georgenia muralis]
MRKPTSWWEANPGRLQWEIDWLEWLGVSLVSQTADEEAGLLRMCLRVPDSYTGIGELPLDVTFPQAYPFAEPVVVAPSLALAHHQHPFAKNLCLLTRGVGTLAPDGDGSIGHDGWEPGMSLAGLLRDQLRDVIELGQGSGVTDREARQGEPFAVYYSYEPISVVLVDSLWGPFKTGESGAMELDVYGAVSFADHQRTVLLVCELDRGASDAVRMPEAITRFWAETAASIPCNGRWVYLDDPVMSGDPEEVWLAAARADAGSPTTQHSNGVDFEARLVGFPEEHGPGVSGTGWLLVIRRRPGTQAAGNRAQRRRQQLPGTKPQPWTYHLIRAVRTGEKDIRARVPRNLEDLSHKSALIIGVGALGSVVAEQLARNGIRSMFLMDRDVMEPGNAARHACTTTESGLPKASGVASLVRRINPFIQVGASNLSVGAVISVPSDHADFIERISTTDILIDASADLPTQRLTAELAQRAGKDWVSVHGTNGAWAGEVVAVPAGADWCYGCYLAALGNGGLPRLPADQEEWWQPVGCAEPTFVGSSIDLTEIALLAVRTAAGMLAGRQQSGVYSVRTREADGVPIMPMFEHTPITQQDTCGKHRSS